MKKGKRELELCHSHNPHGSLDPTPQHLQTELELMTLSFPSYKSQGSSNNDQKSKINPIIEWPDCGLWDFGPSMGCLQLIGLGSLAV